MPSNIELVQQIYAAIGRGDIGTVTAMMTNDVEIHVPGPDVIPFTGTFRGADGVGQFFQSIGANCDVVALQPTEFVADDDHVVVVGSETLTAKPTGRSWSTEWAMVWTILEGKVSCLREFHQTHAIAAAFE
ncbi:MAG: nuclear transport factor 2 family protein [Actinobacteria bacterium]|nr:nuclear transport factor 2 family protein [Actinomycetota bacterium]